MAKHVVHMASAHSPFDTRIFHKECAALVDAGYKVTLLAPAIPSDVKGGTYQGVEVVPFQYPKNRVTRIFGLTQSMYHYALEVNADLYHIHDWELLPWAARIRRRLGKPVIFDRHEYYIERFRETPHFPPVLRQVFSELYKHAEKFLARKLDAIIVVNPNMEEYCRGLCSNTAVVYNYPTKKIAQRPTVQASRKQVIYVGAMGRGKGYQTFVEAMVLVREKMPEASAVLLGWLEPPEVRAQYIQDEDALRERGGIRLLEKVPHEQVVEYLDQSAVGWIPWLPSFNNLHGTPTKLFEYMAAGKPVVASRFGFIEKYISDSDCGLLADPGNVRQHADAILQLLSCPDEADRMGDNGKRAVLELYNWENEAEKLLSLYNQLLA